MLRDDGYKPGVLAIFAFANIAIMAYLVIFVLTSYEMLAMAMVTFVMFLIQVGTRLRMHRNLLNAVTLLVISGAVFGFWQYYRYLSDA